MPVLTSRLALLRLIGLGVITYCIACYSFSSLGSLGPMGGCLASVIVQFVAAKVRPDLFEPFRHR